MSHLSTYFCSRVDVNNPLFLILYKIFQNEKVHKYTFVSILISFEICIQNIYWKHKPYLYIPNQFAAHFCVFQWSSQVSFDVFVILQILKTNQLQKES